MGPRSGIAARLSADNWNSWSKQFSTHLMEKGLHQYIVSEDAFVIPSKYACTATVAKDKFTSAHKAEGDALRERETE